MNKDFNCIDNLYNIVTYKTDFYSKVDEIETIAIIPFSIVPMMYEKNIHNKELDVLHEIKINGKRYIVNDIEEMRENYFLRLTEIK